MADVDGDGSEWRGSAEYPDGRGWCDATIRALAFKWIRILFRCRIDRVPYDESRYLASPQKRHSPLFKFAAEATA